MTATEPATAASRPSEAGILLAGGQVADGVTPELMPVDIRIRAGRIVEMAAGLAPGDDEVLDVSGLTVFPGFIDAHVHGDVAILDPDVAEAMTRQGLTTVVLGQDGLSFAPSPTGAPGGHDAAAFATRYFAAINGAHPSFAGGSVADLLDSYDESSTVDAAYLAPHGTIRYAVMGAKQRPATAPEIDRMRGLLRDAIDDGARGMSSGLEYAPACWAAPEELEALSRDLAEAGLPHSSHMRGYELLAPGALGELADYARTTGVGTHIAHFHGPADQLADALDAARAEGLDMTFDSYPYLKGASILALIALPTWLPLADAEATVAALRDPETLARLRAHDLPERTDVWPRTTLACVPHPDYRWCEGLGLVEAAERLGEPPAETALRLLIATELRVGCVFAQPPTNSEESVRALARHDAHMAGSDGIYLGGRPHPRGWATFTRFVAQHCLGWGDWTVPDAAAHLSARAAARFGLADRGVLAVGRRADIAVLDLSAVRDAATYEAPRTVAEGARHVLVGGTFTLRDGEMTGALPGRAVR